MHENILRDWLNRRKITDAVIEEFDIHKGSHPILGECIVIPVNTPDGQFSFNKYRRNPLSDAQPKYLYDKGAKATLYAISKAAKKDSLLVTEGELDALVAWSANIPSVSSTGGALSFFPEWSSFFEGREVTICFDNDHAGGEGMVKALKVVPHAKVLFLPDRPGVKDISDYVASGGDLHALLKTAIHFSSLQEVIDHRSERLSTWQSTHFHDAYIKEHTKPDYIKTDRKIQGTSDGDKVARAKGFPINQLIKFNNQSKALCLWHNDKQPSMHYYRDNNRCYCFACGQSADAIDVYMKIHNCSFKQAVEKLL